MNHTGCSCSEVALSDPQNTTCSEEKCLSSSVWTGIHPAELPCVTCSPCQGQPQRGTCCPLAGTWASRAHSALPLRPFSPWGQSPPELAQIFTQNSPELFCTRPALAAEELRCNIQAGVWQWHVLLLLPERLSVALGLSVEFLKFHKMQQGLVLSSKMLCAGVGAGYSR